MLRLIHIKDAMIIDTTIKTPPIVGVPSFERWLWGTSSLMLSCSCLFLRKLINFPPKKMLIINDVTPAPNDLNVIYLKTLNIIILSKYEYKKYSINLIPDVQ
jgi:hypothetical protein